MKLMLPGTMEPFKIVPPTSELVMMYAAAVSPSICTDVTYRRIESEGVVTQKFRGRNPSQWAHSGGRALYPTPPRAIWVVLT